MKKKYFKPTFRVVTIKAHRHLLMISGEETKGNRYYKDETEDPENAI